MTSRWERLAEKDTVYVIDDYERAAYRLITMQVLSASDPLTRKDYHLVADNLREYVAATDAFGVTLRHNASYRYVVAQPRHVLNQQKADKATTLMLLVLADAYHRVRFNGLEGDFGEAYVALPDLQEAYEGLTGRDMPKAGELRAMLAELERWGIVRRSEKVDDTQPFQVMIHPAIADLVTKEWLTQLELLKKQRETDDDDDTEASDVSA
jgi:hypothetical protein